MIRKADAARRSGRCHSWRVILSRRLGAVITAAVVASSCTAGSKAPGSKATATTEPAITSVSTLGDTSAPPATIAATKPCATADLALSRVTAGAAAGNVILIYEFTNTGSQPCTLTGYPGVSVLDRQGRIVQQPAARVAGPGTSQPLPVVTVPLPSQGHAYFLVGSADVVPIPGCPTYYHGVTLRVYPPGDTVPIEEPFDESPFNGFCDLSVGPVHVTQD